jgi:GTPase
MVEVRRAANGSVGRCLVIHPVLRRPPNTAGDAARSPEGRLAEAVGLAQAINLELAGAEIVRTSRWRPGTLLGSGAVETLRQTIETAEVAVVVVDATVSPVQQRNLERAWKCKVIDRTGLILEIFGARARTHEGRLQVELAALTYQRSRLVRSWTHLERQRGGFGFLGGPGESQLEMDRRLITDRIVLLKRELETVRRTRLLHRGARKRVPSPVVALVGYTNAGKSTLFNRLTDSEVVAADALFATLDPTMRRLALPSGRHAILSDTVGFISELPTHLVAAFRATLEEVVEADLVLHVRDIHHPESEAQRDDVHAVLTDLGLGEIVEQGLIEALNKIDLLSQEQREVLLNQAQRNHDVVPISAATGEGCDALLVLLDQRLDGDRPLVRLDVNLSDGAALSWLYAHGEVLKRHDDEQDAHVEVRLSDADLGRFRSRAKDAAAATAESNGEGGE